MESSYTPNVCPSHKKQYIAVFIIGALIGAGLSFPLSKQVGFNIAKERVFASPMGAVFRSPDEVRSISGTVTEIKGDEITIHTEVRSVFDDTSFADRTVIIATDTKIFKNEPTDMATFQKEMEAFMKNIRAGKNNIAPPRPPEPTRTEVEMSDITVGSTITATAEENIKTAKKFTASEIQIQ